MTIEGLLIVGAIIGLIVGLVFRNPKLGCAVLWIVPVAMIAYVYAEQVSHPENIRSTSGLDFLFGPLWPSLGAMAGYVAGAVFRYAISDKIDGR